MKAAIAEPLSASVLVLNRSYSPIHVIRVRRAIGMVYRELAEIIHVEDGIYQNYDFEKWMEMSEYFLADLEDPQEYDDSHEDWIRGINFRIRVPKVIRLHTFDRLPKKTLRFNRRSVFARDENLCQYCEKQYPPSQLSFDHVIPKSRGGKTTWENVVTSCLDCNGKKRNRTPEEAGMKLRKTPVKPKRSPLVTARCDHPKYQVWQHFIPRNPR